MKEKVKKEVERILEIMTKIESDDIPSVNKLRELSLTVESLIISYTRLNN